MKKLNIGIQIHHITLSKQKINVMVIFIKKIKTKEGINSLNLDKVKKDVPSEFEVLDAEPAISFTANHVVVAFKCKLKSVKNEPVSNKKVVSKKKTAAAKA